MFRQFEAGILRMLHAGTAFSVGLAKMNDKGSKREIIFGTVWKLSLASSLYPIGSRPKTPIPNNECTLSGLAPAFIKRFTILP